MWLEKPPAVLHAGVHTMCTRFKYTNGGVGKAANDDLFSFTGTFVHRTKRQAFVFDTHGHCSMLRNHCFRKLQLNVTYHGWLLCHFGRPLSLKFCFSLAKFLRRSENCSQNSETNSEKENSDDASAFGCVSRSYTPNFETSALTVLKIGEGVGIAYKWQV